MRICIYTETALPMIGGQEIVVDSLARQFAAAGHHAVVVAPNPRSAWRTEGWRSADRLSPYPIVRHPRFISTRHWIDSYAYWLNRAVRCHNCDILHCHSTYPTGYLAISVARTSGVPVAITAHGSDVTSTSRKLSDLRVFRHHLAALQAADALVAISDFIAENYRRIAPTCQHIVRIPNGVDTRLLSRQTARPDDLDPSIQPRRYVLFLGRLSRRKGVDVLINALGRMPKAERPLLVIAGVGEERVALERMATELNLAKSVRFVGAAQGGLKAYLLQNSLVGIVPSREWESFQLVILESFAAGRPVVATRLPGLTSLVRHGHTGWLVEPDSPEGLAAAIRAALADAPLRERLGRQARAEAQRFDWKIVAQSYLELFARLIADRQAAQNVRPGLVLQGRS